jgi:hypothetical protein
MGMDPGVLKLADPPLARANGLRHRSLGGKRGPLMTPSATLGHRGRRSGARGARMRRGTRLSAKGWWVTKMSIPRVK